MRKLDEDMGRAPVTVTRRRLGLIGFETEYSSGNRRKREAEFMRQKTEEVLSHLSEDRRLVYET